MEQAAVNYRNTSFEHEEMDLREVTVDANSDDPEMEQKPASDCTQQNGSASKRRKGILDLLLRILLPKSITTTPPPDRKIYY